MNPINITTVLTEDMSQIDLRLQAKLLAPLIDEFPAWIAAVSSGELTVEQVIHYLIASLTGQQGRLSSYRSLRDDFNGRYNRALSESEQKEHILAFCKELGANDKELEADRKALDRWFGHDGLMDRFRKRFAETERQICFILNRLGALTARGITASGNSEARLLWQRVRFEQAVMPFLTHDGDSRVCIAAFRALATVIKSLSPDERKESVSGATLQFVYRCALESRQSVWLQTVALDLLATLSLPSLETALHKRFNVSSSRDDDIFVRKHAVNLLGETLSEAAGLAELLPLILKDPSDYVRQALPSAIRHDSVLLERIACNDPSPQVRAAAVLAVLPPQGNGMPVVGASGLICRVMEEDDDPFVLRVCLRVISNGLELLGEQGDEAAVKAWTDSLLPGVMRLHRESPQLALRRWAGQTREQLWCVSDPSLRALRGELAREIALTGKGKGRKLPLELTAPHDESTMGRVLALLCQDGFSCQLSRSGRNYRLFKGDRFRFSWWRLIYEMRSPSPDKRQAFSHTVARHYNGTLRTPSAIMAEVSPTKVPGEPLLIAEEGGWRPYLPLPDEFLSTLHGLLPKRAVQIVTSEGVTEVTAPHSIFRRMQAAIVLTTKFPHYARLRNWHAERLTSPTEYLDAMTRLGFTVRHTPHGVDNESVDPAVSRFFPLALPFFDSDLTARGMDYFLSVYENSLEDLGIFAALLLALFLGERLLLNRSSRKARRTIPLVVGGWGTRGKSGTERLKAALFSANGFGVISKTTGCEAMMLHSFPFDNLRELFLFRPYDKATIWEQHKFMTLADDLGSEVLLWECMGLNPTYVDILQRCWMRDDIATITNTFPDHEDLQGPAGINVPEVMTRFIPGKSTLITSEEQMLPILAEAAREAGTSITSVGWLEAGLLTRDVLERFPYEEHPYNVALVLAMADTLGFDRDHALKEMAERVIPDIGVLKAYPFAPLRTRRLQFINGMSANDRYGCLGNWSRMGLDCFHPDDVPGNWVTTVVNNRADRVARSKVFANILVNDINADRHFLIGTNLQGLMGYIDKALDEHLEGLSLWPETGDAAAPPPISILHTSARRQRIPVSEETLAARFRAMLGESARNYELTDSLAAGADPVTLREQLAGNGYQYVDQLVAHMQRDRSCYEEYRLLAERLEVATDGQRHSLDREYRGLVKKWFKARLVVIEDYHTTGEQIINQICEETPPHFTNRIMGLQNIKGTGLDFVYRWQAWDNCHALCAELLDDNSARMSRALAELAAFQELGFLCEEHVRKTLESIRSLTFAQTEQFQAEIAIIISNLDNRIQKGSAGLTITRQRNLTDRIIDVIESFLDAGDSIRRRKAADRIYHDMVNERISRQRAALELQNLVRRQKGGWLREQFHRLRSYLGRS